MTGVGETMTGRVLVCCAWSEEEEKNSSRGERSDRRTIVRVSGEWVTRMHARDGRREKARRRPAATRVHQVEGVPEYRVALCGRLHPNDDERERGFCRKEGRRIDENSSNLCLESGARSVSVSWIP
jgi:hypothetical protein